MKENLYAKSMKGGTMIYFKDLSWAIKGAVILSWIMASLYGLAVLVGFILGVANG